MNIKHVHIKLTEENIMGYLPDAEKTYKSFITYQWDKMRTYLHTNKNTVEELSIKISEEKLGNGFLYLEDFSNSIVSNIRSNLSAFSNDSLRGIVNGNYLYHNRSTEVESLLSNVVFQKRLLEVFIKTITNEINELCN